MTVAISLPTPKSLDETFKELFQTNALYEVFLTKFKNSESKGVDRANGTQYAALALQSLETVSKKCLDGSFRFSPYLEILKAKGRGKTPRLISIPTIRDRIVLHQLNKLLAQIYPDCVPKKIATQYIRSISNELKKKEPGTTFVCGCDIKTFYDGIPPKRLLALIQKRLSIKNAISLLKHALMTPTVPKDCRKKEHIKFRPECGVPQGLAISNILAALYLQEVDAGMQNLGVSYFRYVDDVLIYGEEEKVRKAQRSLSARLKIRGLSLHSLKSVKSHFGPLDQSFMYLGYQFKWPIITVRPSTIERLLHSIAEKFSHYLHTKNLRLKNAKYLTADRLAEIFILELNEKISGAINSKRRYGWIAYFNQINDLTLLHKIDSVVRTMFLRMPDFGRVPPIELKTFKRAFYEMKYNPTGGYIHNFDKYETRAERLGFLLERGLLSPDEALQDSEINDRFEGYVKRLLAQMYADEGRMS
jgi:RNA-directed DNA polymerase